MADEYDDRKMFFQRRTDKTIISRRFQGGFASVKMRIASHVIDGQPGLRFATVQDEAVLRETPGGRYQIKAAFLEDDRSIRSLTIQRYNKTGPQDRQHFTFVGSEIDTLINFIAGVRTIQFDSAAKVHLTDEVLREIILGRGDDLTI